MYFQAPSSVMWNTETDSLSVFRPPHQSPTSQKTQRHRLTSWMCFWIPPSVMQLLRKHGQAHMLDAFSGPLIIWPSGNKKIYIYLLDKLIQSVFTSYIKSFSYCFALRMFLHLSVHNFQIYYHLHTIVNSWLTFNCTWKVWFTYILNSSLVPAFS